MPTKYQVTAPSGQTLIIEGDTPPTAAQLAYIFAQAGVDTPPTSPPPEEFLGLPADQNTLGGLLKSGWQAGNPIANIGGLLPFPKALGGSGMDHPLAPARTVGGAVVPKFLADQIGVGGEAVDRFKKGQYGVAAIKAAESLFPVAGPLASHAGNRMEQGDYTGGLGEVLGAGAGAYLTGKAGEPLIRRALTPTVRTPTDPVNAFAEAQTPPVRQTVGQATGNKYAQAVGSLADYTPIGSLIEYLARKRQMKALGIAGEKIAQDVRPGVPVSENVAGQNTQSQMDAKVQAHEDFATHRYGVAEKAQANPWNSRMVERVPGQGKEPMQLPVDYRGIKARLKTVYDELSRSMGVTRRANLDGYTVLENIVHGDDWAPLMRAERDLGSIKEIVRKTDGYEQSLAQQAVRELQGAIDTTASQAGPEVVRALAEARDATRIKFESKALLEKNFGKDNAFKDRGDMVRAVTANGDRNIDMLQRVKEEVPAALPGIARSVLDDLFAQKGEKMLADWKNLGADTKGVLFTKAQLKAIDNFTELSARIARTPNPSGTALVTASGQATGLSGTSYFASPLTAAWVVLGGGGISAFMRSPLALRLFTDATTIALKPSATAALASARATQVATLLRAAQRAAGVPVLAATPAPQTPEASVPTGSAPGSAARQPALSR